MEPELLGLDFTAGPVECCIKSCAAEAKFILLFKPHPHKSGRWYPVCLRHIKDDSACERCLGKTFPRESIETL